MRLGLTPSMCNGRALKLQAEQRNRTSRKRDVRFLCSVIALGTAVIEPLVLVVNYSCDGSLKLNETRVMQPGTQPVDVEVQTVSEMAAMTNSIGALSLSQEKELA